MTTFGLVHGAWHGAWCWELAAPLLEQAGHRVIVMDLPCDDGTVGFDVYADVVCDALADSDDVVLVGHSLAGSTIPLVAARRPIRQLVYLCAVVPEFGRSIFDQLADGTMLYPGYTKGLSRPDAQNRLTWVDRDLARELLFGDCAVDVADRAIDRLRPQARHPYAQSFPLSEFPDVPCTSVVCSDDRVVRPDWSRRIARERLGADMVELAGSHSPNYSRPGDVVDVLLRIGEK